MTEFTHWAIVPLTELCTLAFPAQRPICSVAATLTHEVTEVCINAALNLAVNHRDSIQESFWPHFAFSAAVGVSSGLLVEKIISYSSVNPEHNFKLYHSLNLVGSMALGYIAETAYHHFDE